jgi:DNA-binding LacI/PurR family transcriptional regulator
MVSLKDISRECMVSVATVSKALNNREDISEETKERICRVAKEMGYLPNLSARALKTNRTYNLGVLFVDEARSGLTHSYFSHVLDSFRLEAAEEGYDITFISRQTGKSKLSYYEHSKYRGVDGVVAACVDFEADEVKELVNGDIPVVIIDYLFDNRVCVLSDNVNGMGELVRYIVEQGHEKIAYIYGGDSSVTRDRLGSFWGTLKRSGIIVRDEYMLEGVYHAPDISAALTKQLLTMRDRPTCIIYPDDFSCIGGMNTIKKSGLLIPDDISVAGYDGQRIAHVLEPKITTYQQNTKEIGKIAAKKLIALIEEPKTARSEQIVVKGKLIRGCSVLKC